MASTDHTFTIPANLDRLLAAHRKDATRLRTELGDPEEAMGWIVRDSFDADSLAAAFRHLTEGGSLWDDDEPNER
jgi:hypothetical protein